MTLPFNIALIIPTGIGASIGGYGGDGMTLLPLFADVCDTVITHPNVSNAACFQTLPENVLYVEGYALDRFFAASWGLKPIRQNKIGVLWDSGISEGMEILHLNTIEAVKTVYGVNIISVEKTAHPVDCELVTDPSGRSTGKINNPEVLLEASQKLLSRGAEAIAVCCLMPEVAGSEENNQYQSGQGVDPIGGLEAMISHYLVSALSIPCAHAPVFPYKDALPVTDHLVDPKAASEFIVSTFLPCVLTGLSKAPQYTLSDSKNSLFLNDLHALIVPADALGALPVLACLERNIPILAVLNNQTVMACSQDTLHVEGKIIPCQTYMEALGYLVALKRGITLPQHLKATVATNGYSQFSPGETDPIQHGQACR